MRETNLEGLLDGILGMEMAFRWDFGIGVCNPSRVVRCLWACTPGRAAPTLGLVMGRPFQGLGASRHRCARCPRMRPLRGIGGGNCLCIVVGYFLLTFLVLFVKK